MVPPEVLWEQKVLKHSEKKISLKVLNLTLSSLRKDYLLSDGHFYLTLINMLCNLCLCDISRRPLFKTTSKWKNECFYRCWGLFFNCLFLVILCLLVVPLWQSVWALARPLSTMLRTCIAQDPSLGRSYFVGVPAGLKLLLGSLWLSALLRCPCLSSRLISPGAAARIVGWIFHEYIEICC